MYEAGHPTDENIIDGAKSGALIRDLLFYYK